MSVNEDISSYSTTAASNSPQGTANIGTDLDDHIRDIKKNIRTLSDEVSAVSSQIFLSAGDAVAFVSVGTTFSIGDTLSGSGSFRSGIAIQMNAASLATTSTATGRLIPTRVDQYGRVLNYSPISNFQASATDMKSGTAQDVYVSPFNQANGAPSAKGWIVFDGSGTVSSTTTNLSFNVAGYRRSALGTYVISWTNIFSTDYYPVLVNPGIGIGPNAMTMGSATTSTRYYKFRVITAGGGAPQDSERISVVAYGVWAQP